VDEEKHRKAGVRTTRTSCINCFGESSRAAKCEISVCLPSLILDTLWSSARRRGGDARLQEVEEGGVGVGLGESNG
jgi:hypothetical protein